MHQLTRHKTPQRPDSVKKPKIKLNTNSTPKSTNGAGAKDSTKTKTKGKKATPKENVVQETPEESLKRRQVSRRNSTIVRQQLTHALERGPLPAL